MASEREPKWIKYFSKGPVDTKIKAPANKKVTVYDEKNRSIDLLKDGDPIHVPLAKSYQKRYLIVYDKNKIGYVPENFVAKPYKTTGATENLRISSASLIKYGESKKIEYAGEEINVKAFSSADDLVTSIVRSLKENNNVSERIVEVFENYKSSGTFDKISWTSEVADTEINELGKYVGELLVGVLILTNKNKLSSAFARSINEPIKYFCVPNDPSFAGVDSFIILESGDIVSISNKYGKGAAASFFTNILPKSIRYADYLQDSVLKQIIKSAFQATVTPLELEQKRKAKKIVYQYGIHNILGLNKIVDTYSIYNDIKDNKTLDKMKAETIEVISAIQNYPNLNANIKNQLPLSVTAFFCREIVKKLNDDSKSVEQMLKILSGKNFWQANLNNKKWKDGDIEYSFINSGDCSIKIISSKSAIGSLTADQGLINYEIKLP